MAKYSKGDTVEWNWGNGTGSGKVDDIFTRKVTRNADEDNPAYLIKQDDGDQVLKSESELSKA